MSVENVVLLWNVFGPSSSADSISELVPVWACHAHSLYLQSHSLTNVPAHVFVVRKIGLA